MQNWTIDQSFAQHPHSWEACGGAAAADVAGAALVTHILGQETACCSYCSSSAAVAAGSLGTACLAHAVHLSGIHWSRGIARNSSLCWSVVIVR